MFSFKADDIYDVAQAFHLGSKSIGLTAFSIERKNGIFAAKRSLWNVMCIAISTIWSIAAGIFFIRDFGKVSEKFSAVEANVFEKSVYVVLVGFFMISTLSNWWIFFSEKQFCKILNLLKEVDDNLEEMKVPINLKKHKKFIMTFVVTAITLIVACVVLSYRFDPSSGMFESPIFVITSMCFLIELGIFTFFHFIFMVWAVRLRYEKINLFLQENFLNEIIFVHEENEKLVSVAAIHDKLADVSEGINHCYGISVSLILTSFSFNNSVSFLQMMMMTGNNFVFITIHIFSLTKMWLLLGSQATSLCINMIFWIFLYIVLIYIIVHMAHFTKREVELTS